MLRESSVGYGSALLSAGTPDNTCLETVCGSTNWNILRSAFCLGCLYMSSSCLFSFRGITPRGTYIYTTMQYVSMYIAYILYV